MSPRFRHQTHLSGMRDDIIPTYLSVVHTFTNILETGGNVRDVTFTEQSLKTSSHLYAQNLIVVRPLGTTVQVALANDQQVISLKSSEV